MAPRPAAALLPLVLLPLLLPGALAEPKKKLTREQYKKNHDLLRDADADPIRPPKPTKTKTSLPPPGCAEKVVVVGGGFAGLAAARDLLLSGHADVTVVEAEAGVGGRTKSLEVHDPATNLTWPGITLGAHWILGSSRGPELRDQGAAFEYADLAGVPAEDYQDSWYRENSERLVPAGVDRFLPDERTVQHENFRRNMTPRDATMEKYWYWSERHWKQGAERRGKLDRSWEKSFGFVAKAGHPLGDEFKACMINSVSENDFGGPSALWRDVSYGREDMWAGQPWEGVAYTADYTLRHAWTSIYQWLEEDIKSMGGKILLNTKVKRIKRVGYADGPVELLTRSAGGGGWDRLYADRVVVTVSVGVLKQSLKSNKGLKFVPALPTRNRQAIKKIGMGQLEKIYLFFPTMFWNRTKLQAEEGDEGMYILGHIPASLDIGDKGAIKFMGILFHPENSSCQMWFSGDDAIRYMKGVKRGTSEFADLQETITNMAMDAIRDIFNNDADFLDVDDNPIEVEEPWRHLTFMSDWTSNENFLGCYAYLNHVASNVTQWEDGVGGATGLPAIPDSNPWDKGRRRLMEGYSLERLALGAPASEGPWAERLFFAGEATSLTVPALVHGAIESGWRAAIEVNYQSMCAEPPSPAPTVQPSTWLPTTWLPTEAS